MADDPVAAEAPEPEAGPATCIFCGRPSAQVVYAWPDWLCRFLAEHQDTWRTMRAARTTDLAMVERAEREADKTVDCVCGACSAGWMQRLEDNVRPFLEPMILGDPTPLPAARRKLLARWAAKTALLIERAAGASPRTPRAASEYVRKVGVHPGAQVLVGQYGGRLRMLTSERTVSTRAAGAEASQLPPVRLTQTTLVMGNVVLQVFSDSSRDAPPELTDDALRPFIALVGNPGRRVVWPPELPIDDERYDQLRIGDAGARERHGRRPVQEGHEPTMETPDPGDRHGQPAPALNGDGDGNGNGTWSSVVQLLGSPTDAAQPTDETHAAVATAAAVPAVAFTPTDLGEHSAGPGAAGVAGPFAPFAIDSELQSPAPGDAPARPARSRRTLAFAAIAIALVLGLAGFGVVQRSDAARSRAHDATTQRRNRALEAQIRIKTQQLSASQNHANELNDRVTTLTSGKRTVGNVPGLSQLVDAIPPATDGLRTCASSALAAASDALDFAAAFPTSADRVDAAASTVASVCERANTAANTLDDLADAAKR